MSRALSAVLLVLTLACPTVACCPAPRLGNWVINADQTVILLWDPVAKQQHFIRKATFASEADDFWFLIPSPTQPELAESGNAAFDQLHEVTAPRIVSRPRGGGGGCNLGCSIKESAPGVVTSAEVRVLEEKIVAGFQASVLEADDTDALLRWLKDHDYDFSPAVAAWAQPYIEQKWKITALKVAKDAPLNEENRNQPKQPEQLVQASALRLSFATDRPLFPYREPDYGKLAGEDSSRQKELAQRERLLRIYFVSNARYEGNLTPEQPWTGKAVWAGKLSEPQRLALLKELQLPEEGNRADLYLSEFEDNWPYRGAPADRFFAEAALQKDLRRPDVYVYGAPRGDALLALLVVAACSPLLLRGRAARRRVFG